MRATERARLSSLLDGHPCGDPLAVAGRLCGLCAAAVGASGVALVVVSEDNRSTVCASDALSAELEDLAFVFGEGPSVEASRRGCAVLVADLVREPPSRWPWFAPTAARAGARAMFAFPLYLAGCVVGVLVLYRASPGRLEPQGVRDAWVHADAAAELLSVDAPASAAVLDSAWVVGDRSGFRGRVYQAVGLTMACLQVDAADALALIAARAFVTGEPIGAVADAILTQNLRFEQA